MDTRTGEIRYGLTEAELKSGFYQQVDPNTMTEKQKKTNRVSKHDNRSVLGQMFTGNRAERRKQEKLARRQRKNPYV